MNYLFAILLTAILFLILREKRKLDSVHSLLKEFQKERAIQKREQELENLLKQFAAR